MAQISFLFFATLVVLAFAAGGMAASCPVGFTMWTSDATCSGSSVSQTYTAEDGVCTNPSGDSSSFRANCTAKTAELFLSSASCTGGSITLEDSVCQPLGTEASVKVSFNSSGRLTSWLTFLAELFSF